MARIQMELGGRETMLLTLGMTFVMSMLDRQLQEFGGDEQDLDELFTLMEMRMIGGDLFVRLNERLGVPREQILAHLRGEDQ
jgi:hypothetical protein